MTGFFINKPLIIIDLEMTGLVPEKHQIIELAAAYCDPEDFSVIDKFWTLVGPPEGETLQDIKNKADPFSMQINGIDIDTLEHSPSPYEAVKAFQSWLPVSPYNVQLAGHGCSMDYVFLDRVVKANPKKLKSFAYDFIDTKSIARYLFSFNGVSSTLGYLTDSSLVNVAETLNIKTIGAHRASDDVETCRKVLKKLYTKVDINYRS